MMLLDTSGLLAAIDQGQRMHAPCAAALQKARAPLVLSPFVLAELDYLLATKVGIAEELALLGEVARGAYELAVFGERDLLRAAELVRTYQKLSIGLADASIVVLAERLRATDVLTLDRKHFSVLRKKDGKTLRLFPDALLR